MTVTYPNGGETCTQGFSCGPISWTASGWTGSSVVINLSYNGGTSWSTVCGSVGAPNCDGGSCTATWTLAAGCSIGTNNLIRIMKSDDNNINDISNNVFIIEGQGGG